MQNERKRKKKVRKREREKKIQKPNLMLLLLFEPWNVILMNFQSVAPAGSSLHFSRLSIQRFG